MPEQLLLPANVEHKAALERNQEAAHSLGALVTGEATSADVREIGEVVL